MPSIATLHKRDADSTGGIVVAVIVLLIGVVFIIGIVIGFKSYDKKMTEAGKEQNSTTTTSVTATSPSNTGTSQASSSQPAAPSSSTIEGAVLPTPPKPAQNSYRKPKTHKKTRTNKFFERLANIPESERRSSLVFCNPTSDVDEDGYDMDLYSTTETEVPKREIL